MIADTLHHRETLLEARFIEIIEKDSADATRFLAMLEIKILVTPCLETWIKLGAKWR